MTKPVNGDGPVSKPKMKGEVKAEWHTPTGAVYIRTTHAVYYITNEGKFMEIATI